MTDNGKDNIANCTSDKKQGALYREDTTHVESQDISAESESSSEEE